MTCYVTYDGTIKLDNHVVGMVRPVLLGPHTWWVWAARVNGADIGTTAGAIQRDLAFDWACEECLLEATVIR